MQIKQVMRVNGGDKGLRDLINDLKKKLGEEITLIEVGSFMGESAEIFAEMLPKSKIYCIDPFESGYDNADSASSFDFKEVENQFDIRASKFNNINKLKCYSTDVKMQCDVVYIDGLHTYEGVKADILHWKNLASGAICGHDYYKDKEFIKMHPHIEGVNRAVIELLGIPDKNYSDSSWLVWQ
jgi:hypothetical protein